MGKGERRHWDDLTGVKINMLTVLERVYVDNKPKWHCLCECGNHVNVRHSHLMNGQKSCGCYARKLLGDRKRKHGKRFSKLYNVWNSMRMRCNNPNNPSYKDYGGRGIKVCHEWDSDFSVFYNWAIDNGYEENAEFMNCTIERIDTNGNYEPLNCRFATMEAQCNNRRNNIFLEYNGERHTVSQWAKIIGINSHTLYYRVKSGWSVGESLGFEHRKGRRIENA